MILYPAIDLIGGQCVRLLQGRFDAVTTYDLDPLVRLKSFEDQGASHIHIVDLDGAKAGCPQQSALIAKLCQATQLTVQSGGGVRTRDHVTALRQAGVSQVVVGSLAAKSPNIVRDWLDDFGQDHLSLAFDVTPKDEGFEIALHGWQEASGIDLFELLEHYPKGTLKHVLVTDVSRDGLLSGPNAALMSALKQKRPDLILQASGGVSGLSDLTDLKARGIDAVIIGKALYEGRFSLSEALNHAG